MEVVLQEINAVLRTLNDGPRISVPAVPLAVPLPASTGRDANTDRAALMETFKATGGRVKKPRTRFFKSASSVGWKKSTGWGTSRPLGEWHGVAVDPEGRVVKLDLHDNNLTGTGNVLLGKIRGRGELGQTSRGFSVEKCLSAK